MNNISFNICYGLVSIVLYIGAEILQQNFDIHIFIRHHLSDVGFPMMYSFIFYMNTLFNIKYLKYCVLAGILLGVGYEFCQLTTGQFDMIDILCYVLGGIIVFVLYRMLKDR